MYNMYSSMLLSTSFLPILLANLAESARYQWRKDYAYSHPGPNKIPLSSMLLATPGSKTMSSASRTGHARTSLPKGLTMTPQLAPMQQKLQVPDFVAREAPVGGGPEDGCEKVKALCDSAKVLQDLGLHDKAKERYSQCQEAMKRGHRDLKSYRHKLQMKLRKEGDQDAELMKKVFEFKQSKYGNDHPQTFKSRQNYAEVLNDVGRHREAEVVLKELLKLRRNELGSEHEDTLKTMSSYAETLIALGRNAEALSLQKEALEIQTREEIPRHAEPAIEVHARPEKQIQQKPSRQPINVVSPVREPVLQFA
jgi:hypothetical protein